MANKCIVLKSREGNYKFYMGIPKAHNPKEWPGYEYIRSFKSIREAQEEVNKQRKK